MISKVNIKPEYIPPKSLGDGLKRVKDAFGITESIASNKGHRLYATENRSTVYMTTGLLQKTGKNVPESKEISYKDCDTFAGTVLRIKRSEPCGKNNAKPDQLMQLMRTKFYSDTVKDVTGKEHKPVFVQTDFRILNSEQGTPVVVYGGGKYSHSKDSACSIVKEIHKENVPQKYTGVNAPDGNIVYYVKDTARDGKRSVEMKMYEAGVEVPILKD